MTTQKLMMTTALKELYSFLDEWQIDNDGHITDPFRRENRHVAVTVTAAGPIPIEETLDPKSPNYMRWYDPDVATEQKLAECAGDPISLRPSAVALHYLLLGTLDGRRLQNRFFCPMVRGTAKAPQLTARDFADWTLVTLRPARAGERTLRFYDLPRLRAAKELALSLPRIGFFSTPAFFANWQTNVSNQMRVTLHQALIVATGRSIEPTDRTSPDGAPGMDAAHVNDGACRACHKVLDPSRSIFSATWSWNYHHQLDEKWRAQPGVFAFRGVIEPVASMADFGRVLAAHPLVAPAWVQKLCYWANSAACDEDDEEFQRLVRRFRESGYSWGTLVRELATSPITTGVARTRTRDKSGEVVAVARRDHLCAALSARLRFRDVCGLDALGRAADERIAAIVSGLPSDAYGRGAEIPILPNQPTLFFAAGTENICESIAARVVDPPAGSLAAEARRWSSAQPDQAIADFVKEVMGLAPSDSRAAPARAVLAEHFSSASAQPRVSATDALRSTFVVACMAPSTVSIGL
jgi:hypothetical protein